MKRQGTATAPLHGGHCPPWLFEHMKKLSAAIAEAIIREYGTDELLHRFSDPVWFQTLGSVLGFDWHSSGLTTVVLGAFKEGWADRAPEYGLFVAGGKGKASRKTPQEIDEAGNRIGLGQQVTHLTDTSRLVAKVDSGLVQDGYDLYHHVFLFNQEGHWAVIQQGMDQDKGLARRYHWLGSEVSDFTHRPHHGIVGIKESGVLDLTSDPLQPTHQASLDVIQQPLESLKTLRKLYEDSQGQRHLVMPRYHNIPSPTYFNKALLKAYEAHPSRYVDLVALPGIGASTLRALAMVAEVIHGTPLTFHDPVRYSFAHGGKDGTPFPVRRQDYLTTLTSLEAALEKAKLGELDKMKALRRLSQLTPP